MARLPPSSRWLRPRATIAGSFVIVHGFAPESAGRGIRSISAVRKTTATEALGDAEVLARMAERDLDAFEVLYQRHAGYLVAVCTRRLGDSDEAEEVAGDILWEPWESGGGYDPGRCRLRTWLYTVARNRCIDRLRSRARAPHQDPVSVDLPASPRSNPAQRASDNETLGAVAAALAELPQEHLRAIELCVYEGYTHREAAELLGQPLGTVKSRIKRALDTLRTLLGSQGDPS